MKGYFKFRLTAADGTLIGEWIRVNTVTGVYMQCPSGMSHKKVAHLCELAYTAPGHPVDLTHFQGQGDKMYLAWSARIYYVESDNEPARAIRETA